MTGPRGDNVWGASPSPVRAPAEGEGRPAAPTLRWAPVTPAPASTPEPAAPTPPGEGGPALATWAVLALGSLLLLLAVLRWWEPPVDLEPATTSNSVSTEGSDDG